MKALKKPLPKIVLIGAGRLATHLGLRLKEMDVSVVQVFSRTKRKSKSLAKKLNCDASTDLKTISAKADLYIIAVHDSAIAEVAEKLSKRKFLQTKLFVHTSGATPSTVFKPYFKHYGVFYPLQTFSSNRVPDFSQIPICVDARYAKDRKQLTVLAELLSQQVYPINDQQRAILHVAAVFVNNFSNHMFTIAAKIAEDNELPFDLLRPLLLETALKVQSNAPAAMQTGPAVRKDANTINQHLAYLEAHYPAYAVLYRMLSASIDS